MAKSSLRNRLKEARAKLGMTQAELAELTGVTRKSINTIENGVYVPTTVLTLRLARALKRRVEDLFYLDE